LVQTSLADFSNFGDTRVADVRAEIDISNADLFEAGFYGFPDANSSKLVIGLTECPYIDSSGLRVLIRLANAFGSRLAIVAGQGSHARRLIEVAGLAEAMSVHDSLHPALASLSAPLDPM
jgi:anti-sigma B factor antagonist